MTVKKPRAFHRPCRATQKLAIELNLDDRWPLAKLEDLVAEILKH